MITLTKNDLNCEFLHTKLQEHYDILPNNISPDIQNNVDVNVFAIIEDSISDLFNFVYFDIDFL